MSDSRLSWRPDRRTMLALAAGSTALAHVPPRARAAPAKDMSADIDGIVARAMQASPFPGVCVAIERAGRVVHRKGYGLSDVENGVAVTPQTVFPIGSITKSMTGLATMQLVSEARIDLDAPAGTYLSQLPSPARDVRIRNLLDHTSGLVNYTDVPEFPRDSQCPYTRDDVLGWFAARPLQFPTGSRWSYTNSGLYVVGLVIEKVTGMTYAGYLEKNVFAPFGMNNSSLKSWRELIAHRAHGYLPGNGGTENAPRYDPLVPFAAGGVLSTVDDMLKYRRGVFGDGPTPQRVRDLILTRDKLTDGTPLPYALGCLQVGEFEGHRRIGHAGDIYGFAAQYAWYPDNDVTIIILTNLQDGTVPPPSLERKIARTALGIPQSVIVDLPLSADEAAKFTGSFEIGKIRFAFNRLGFIYRDGALCAGYDGSETRGKAFPLKYQGHGAFVSTLDDEQRFSFSGAPKADAVVMSWYGGTFTAART